MSFSRINTLARPDHLHSHFSRNTSGPHCRKGEREMTVEPRLTQLIGLAQHIEMTTLPFYTCHHELHHEHELINEMVCAWQKTIFCRPKKKKNNIDGTNGSQTRAKLDMAGCALLH
ncbi:unnamed protein product, partial [Ixodes persulcatus]